MFVMGHARTSLTFAGIPALEARTNSATAGHSASWGCSRIVQIPCSISGSGCSSVRKLDMIAKQPPHARERLVALRTMSLIHWNKSTLLAGLLTAALSAQTYPVCGINDSTTLCTVFDNSGTSMLSGTYFIREIQLSNVSTNGTSVGLVFSLYGTMTFTPTTDTTGVDNGTYTFSGEELEYEKGAS